MTRGGEFVKYRAPARCSAGGGCGRANESSRLPQAEVRSQRSLAAMRDEEEAARACSAGLEGRRGVGRSAAARRGRLARSLLSPTTRKASRLFMLPSPRARVFGGVSLSTPAKRAGAKPPGRPIADRCGARGGRLAASVRGGAPSRREERPFFCLPAHRIRAPCFSRPPTPHHRRRVRAASVVDLIPLLPRCFETPEERARAHSFRRFPPGESRVEPLSSASTSSAICKERTPRGFLAPQPARCHRPERRARRKQRAAASPSSHLTSSNDGKGAGKKHIGCFHRLRLRREERSVW